MQENLAKNEIFSMLHTAFKNINKTTRMCALWLRFVVDTLNCISAIFGGNAMFISPPPPPHPRRI